MQSHGDCGVQALFFLFYFFNLTFILLTSSTLCTEGDKLNVHIPGPDRPPPPPLQHHSSFRSLKTDSVGATQQTAISLMLSGKMQRFSVLQRCWNKLVSVSTSEEVQPGAEQELFTAGTICFYFSSLVRMAMREFNGHNEALTSENSTVHYLLLVQWESYIYISKNSAGVKNMF